MKKILLAVIATTLLTSCAHTTGQKRYRVYSPGHLESSVFMCRYLSDLKDLQSAARNEKLFEAKLKTSHCRQAEAGREFAMLDVSGEYVKIAVETATGAVDGWTTYPMLASSF